MISEKNGISSVIVKLQKNRLFLVNNVKYNYTAVDLFKLNSMPCFGAKVVYCWSRWFSDKNSFFIKADKLLSILGVDTSDSCNLGIKFKRMIKALHSIGYEVEIIKEKKGLDARRISALRFNFKEINTTKFNQFVTKLHTLTKENMVKTNPTKPTIPTKENMVKTNPTKPTIPTKENMVKTNPTKPTIPTKENDVLTRFKNALKKLDTIKPIRYYKPIKSYKEL
ncbi:hypothetical protein F7207_08085 [Helicobacter pylori]|nr:hypothetical protein [Helicobacter pylori]